MTYAGINDEPHMMPCDGNAEHYDEDRCRLCVSEKECRREWFGKSEQVGNPDGAVDMQKNEVNEVLDKIRADVEHMIPWDKTALSMKLGVLKIIDKYKEESENT